MTRRSPTSMIFDGFLGLKKLAQAPVAEAGVTKIYANADGRLNFVDAALGSGALGAILGVEIRKSGGNQAVANNSGAIITFETQVRDELEAYNPAAPTRLTAPTAGWYMVSAVITLGSAAALVLLYVNKNGVDDTATRPFITAGGSANANLGGTYIAGSGLAYLAAGDYLEVNIAQSSGGSVNVGDGSHFSMVRLPG